MKAHISIWFIGQNIPGSTPRDTVNYDILGSYLLEKPMTPKFSDSDQSAPECGCTPKSVCPFCRDVPV